jgi:hypothetical protein
MSPILSRVGRSSQATPAAVEKSYPRLTHRNQDTPVPFDHYARLVAEGAQVPRPAQRRRAVAMPRAGGSRRYNDQVISGGRNR